MAGFTWEDARAKLVEARERALQLGGPENIARQRAGGRWTIRERIDHITDPASFLEVGTVATHKRFDTEGNRLPDTSSGYVMGLGQIDDRDVAVGGEDYTVEGGVLEIHADRLKGGMGGFIEGTCPRVPHTPCNAHGGRRGRNRMGGPPGLRPPGQQCQRFTDIQAHG